MCPQCKQTMLSAKIEAIQLYELNEGTLNGVKYTCPSCGSVLSIGVDPIAQKNQIVSEILAVIGKK